MSSENNKTKSDVKSRKTMQPEDLNVEDWKAFLPKFKSCLVIPDDISNNVVEFKAKYTRDCQCNSKRVSVKPAIKYFTDKYEVKDEDPEMLMYKALFSKVNTKKRKADIMLESIAAKRQRVLSEITENEWKIILPKIVERIDELEDGTAKWNSKYHKQVRFSNTQLATSVLVNYYKNLPSECVDKDVQELFGKLPSSKSNKVKIPAEKNYKKHGMFSVLTDDDWKKLETQIKNEIVFAKNDQECDTWKDCSKQHHTILYNNNLKFSIRALIYFRHNKSIYPKSTIRSMCENKNCVSPSHLYEILPANASWNDRVSRIIQRIKSRCVINNVIGCWLWMGATNDDGYGYSKFKNMPECMTHRLIYVLTYGLDSLKKEEKLRHDHGPNGLCIDRTCCNPSHCKPGTALNNSNDMDLLNTRRIGEDHANSTITDKIAQEIKDSKGDGRSIKQRAEDFNVSFSVVAHIDSNTSWRHLPRNGVPLSELDIQKHENEKKKNREIQRQRLTVGFTHEQYELSIQNILNKTTQVDCSILIGHNTEEKIYPCLLMNNNASNCAEGSIGSVSRAAHIIMYEYYQNACQKFECDMKYNIIRHLCKPVKGYTCVEESHLKPGTAKQNAKDAIFWLSRGKLNFTQAEEIRFKASSGITSQELSKQYGVCYETIRDVIEYRSWTKPSFEVCIVQNNMVVNDDSSETPLVV